MNPNLRSKWSDDTPKNLQTKKKEDQEGKSKQERAFHKDVNIWRELQDLHKIAKVSVEGAPGMQRNGAFCLHF